MRMVGILHRMHLGKLAGGGGGGGQGDGPSLVIPSHRYMRMVGLHTGCTWGGLHGEGQGD